MRELISKHYPFLFFLGILTAVSFWVSRISPAPPQTNLVDLASAFLNGKLDLIQPVRVWNDYAIFQDKYYLPYGPLTGVLFIPFVLLFGINFPQQSIIPLIALGTFITIYKISRNLGAPYSVALWLVTFFILEQFT